MQWSLYTVCILYSSDSSHLSWFLRLRVDLWRHELLSYREVAVCQIVCRPRCEHVAAGYPRDNPRMEQIVDYSGAHNIAREDGISERCTCTRSAGGLPLKAFGLV